MHPILFHLGPLPIHGYGVMIALGFLACISLARYLSHEAGLNVEKVLDMIFLGFAVGMAGGRMLFVVTQYEFFLKNPAKIFFIWEGGFVFLGGLITGVPFCIAYAKKHRLNVWKIADITLPALALGHVFGRLGCFMAGCCYGKPTDSIFGLRFDSPLVEASLRGIPIHPTQLYESSAMLALTIGLVTLSKFKKFDGQVGLTYFMAYPAIRSLIEIYRGDLIRGFVIEGWLSTSQFLSLIIFSIALGFLVYRLKHVKIESPASRKSTPARSRVSKAA